MDCKLTICYFRPPLTTSHRPQENDLIFQQIEIDHYLGKVVRQNYIVLFNEYPNKIYILTGEERHAWSHVWRRARHEDVRSYEKGKKDRPNANHDSLKNEDSVF